MSPISATTALILASLTMCLAVGAGDQPSHRRPGPLETSPAERSSWLDQAVPKLTAGMRNSKEVHAKVAAAIPAGRVAPLVLVPRAEGLAPADLQRWATLVNAAVSANTRYGSGAKASSPPRVSVLGHSRVVRVELIYPAPAAEVALEPGPVAIDAWVCPDRETALALYWFRSGNPAFDESSPETIRRTVLDDVSHSPPIDPKEAPPGEASAWAFPRNAISVDLAKGHKPMPTDRLMFLRGNVVVEVSTVEYTWDYKQKEWLALWLRQCASDIKAMARSIDAGLVRLVKPPDPKSK